MEINILAFGQIAEITGKQSWKISGVKNTDELKRKLEEEFPGFQKINYSIAVNKIVIQENTELNPGDVAALLPPFSGG
ncbi:MAG TPA: MoaD/ThiS family protein [Ignavibacteria bacterium]|nr:MoaD/ThiS family protein [Ignavibacteria bacterium]